MKKQIKEFRSVFLALACILGSGVMDAEAGLAKRSMVEGYITKIEKEIITLATPEKDVQVDRKFIPDYFTIRPGFKVSAYFPTNRLPAARSKR